METGYLIEEGGIISRVAEADIAFAADAEYAPVIIGGTDDQVLPATAAAATVLGFVKKPLYGAIEAGDIVSVVTRGIIKVHVTGAAPMNSALQVDAVVTTLDALVIAAGAADSIYKRVARTLYAVNGELAFVEIRLGA